MNIFPRDLSKWKDNPTYPNLILISNRLFVASKAIQFPGVGEQSSGGASRRHARWVVGRRMVSSSRGAMLSKIGASRVFGSSSSVMRLRPRHVFVFPEGGFGGGFGGLGVLGVLGFWGVCHCDLPKK